MSLVHEATVRFPGFSVGDLKIAHYSISYSAGAIVKPSNDPSWILLNGCSLDTTTYAALFAIYGYSYGGSGANFNLPDLTEGRIPITKGLTNFTSLAASGGEISHALSTAEIPSHAHSHTLTWSANAHGHTPSAGFSADGAHNHSTGSSLPDGSTRSYRTGATTTQAYSSNTGDTTGGALSNHYHVLSLSLNNNTSGVSLTGGVSNAGSGTAHNNMQPYIVVGGWLVKFQ
jgi:microcystin-dependent protein